MLETPSLDVPFADERDRGWTLARLLGACIELDELRALSQRPFDLSVAQRRSLSRLQVAGDSVELKLRRWASLFGDELDAVLDSRNRVVHGLRLTDKELRGAVWLADQLLALVHPSEASSATD